MVCDMHNQGSIEIKQTGDFYKCWQICWWSTDLYYMSRDA